MRSVGLKGWIRYYRSEKQIAVAARAEN
jgi:hypothetical protein